MDTINQAIDRLQRLANRLCQCPDQLGVRRGHDLRYEVYASNYPLNAEFATAREAEQFIRGHAREL